MKYETTNSLKDFHTDLFVTVDTKSMQCKIIEVFLKTEI